MRKLNYIIFGMIFLAQGMLFAQFNGDRAFDYLKKQVAFGPRNPGSTGHKACLTYLVKELRAQSDSVRLQSFNYQNMRNKEQFTLTNVIASFKPAEKKRIFFAAHWDTRPRADYDTKANRHKPIPGANDGASGVAVLLEIARQLRINPPPVGVDLILFDGEDYGEEGHLEDYFLGSRYFAKHAKGYRPAFGILLDMVGDANLTLPKEGYSQQYLPWLVDKVWSVAADLGFSEFEDRTGSFISDDHLELIKQGIPCIDIIDFSYPAPGTNYWHTLQDTPDKCSAQSLETVGLVMMELIYGQ